MVLSFSGGVTSSSAHPWFNLSESGNDQTRIMANKIENDLGKPIGVVLSATTSFRLPISHELVFDFLRDDTPRTYQGTNSAGQADVQILQECSSHPTGSYIVYAPADDLSINLLLANGNPELVGILPSGFTVYPSGPTPLSIPGEDMGGSDIEVGSILTVAFQVSVNSAPAANISVPSVFIINNLLESTCQKIRAALTPQSA